MFLRAPSYAPSLPPSFLEEPPNMRGLLFKQDRAGKVEVLKYAGGTNPDTKPDIPEDAVLNGQVFISVDGIGQDWKRHTEQIRDWFLGGEKYGTDLGGPIIGIHEGEGKSGLHDGLRILRNSAYLKALQGGCSKPARIKKAAYKNDPSVKAIHDQLKQSLKVGRRVTFMAHSGGAAQTALALALLAEEDDGVWREAIADKVRVLGTAPAASREDFEWAGVEPEDIMITGSQRDPVYEFFRNHVEAKKPWTLAPFLWNGIKASIQFALRSGPFHSGEYIFGENRVPEGSYIESFLLGAKGSDRKLA